MTNHQPEDDEGPEVQVSSVGCAIAMVGICLFLILVNPNFWAGLRSVVEAIR